MAATAAAGRPRPRYAEPAASGEATEQLGVDRDRRCPTLCRRFGARVVRGHRPGARAGARPRAGSPRSAPSRSRRAVDATNYVLWDTGQPLHAFDFDKLAGGLARSSARRAGARSSSRSTASSARSSPPTSSSRTRERAVSLAGIMGGLDTAVTDATTQRPARGGVVGSRRRSAGRRGASGCTRTRRTASSAARTSTRSPARSTSPRACSSSPPAARSRPGLLDAHGERLPRSAARPCASRGCACSRGDSRLDLDFAEEALAPPRLRARAQGQAPVRLDPALPRRTCAARTTSSRRSCASTATTGCPRACRRRRAPGEVKRAAARRRGAPDATRPRRRASSRPISYPFVDRDADERRSATGSRLTGHGARAALARQSARRARGGTCARRSCRACSTRSRATCATAPATSALFEVGRAFGAPRRVRTRPSRSSRGGSPSPSRASAARTGASRRSCAPADFFDAKGLVEALLGPWMAGVGARLETACRRGVHRGRGRDGANALGGAARDRRARLGAERERRGLAAAVFAGEILVDAIPAGDRPFRLRGVLDPAADQRGPLVRAADAISRGGELEAFVRAARARAPRVARVRRPLRGPRRRRGTGEDDDPADVPLAGPDPRAGRSEPGNAAPGRGARLPARAVTFA